MTQTNIQYHSETVAVHHHGVASHNLPEKEGLNVFNFDNLAWLQRVARVAADTLCYVKESCTTLVRAHP